MGQARRRAARHFELLERELSTAPRRARSLRRPRSREHAGRARRSYGARCVPAAWRPWPLARPKVHLALPRTALGMVEHVAGARAATPRSPARTALSDARDDARALAELGRVGHERRVRQVRRRDVLHAVVRRRRVQLRPSAPRPTTPRARPARATTVSSRTKVAPSSRGASWICVSHR